MNLSFFKQDDLFAEDRMLSDFLRPEDLCSTIQNEIAPHISLTDLEDMYKEGARPPTPPESLLVSAYYAVLRKAFG